MKIKVPTSWSDITLEKFDKLVEVSNNVDLTDIEREMKLVSICTDLSLDDIESLEMGQYSSIVSKLAFLSTPVKNGIPNGRIFIDKKGYEVDMFMGKISAGQFLDYQTMISREDLDKRSARLLACFTYPVGAKYNDGSYDVEELVDKIYTNVSVAEVAAYTNFFMLEYKVLSEIFLQSSEKKIMKLKEISEQEKKELIAKLRKSRAIINSFGQ